jgi:opacity protein-like surface antigen
VWTIEDANLDNPLRSRKQRATHPNGWVFAASAVEVTRMIAVSTVRTSVLTATLIALIALAAPRESAAQGFISPFLGYDFGGDSGCPQVSGCEDKNLNIGVSFGSIGSVFGAELEIAQANDFFGETPGVSSSVLTVMGNVMVAPKFGPAQPYALAGLGLMKTHVELSLPGLLETDNNHFGWDVGGGVIGWFGDHVGIRGDLRYFHAFQDLEILGFSLADTKLDFGRVYGGVIFKF